MLKILHVVGARPNFMKVSPVMHAMARQPSLFEQVLLHTGQHYDQGMSQVFLEEFGLPEPDINLGVGSGSHAWQTGQVLIQFEFHLLRLEPDWVFVYGDVNSTLACALACSKLGVKVAHVEAGLRSFDRSMPEEINRLLVDQMADVLYTPSSDADSNLRREGISPDRVSFVGNVMIDTLVRMLPRARRRWDAMQSGLKRDRFVLVTLHRPANVDRPERLREVMSALDEIAEEVPIIFPAHPRTRRQLSDLGLETANRLTVPEPLGYLDFLALQMKAELVITDSGGIQEETTYLGVPCLTVRPNTERPVTVEEGSNELVDADRPSLVEAAKRRLGEKAPCEPPKYWDGRTSERIVEDLLRRSNRASVGC